MAETEKGNPSTELRVIIIEDAKGNLTINYETYQAGTDGKVVLPMRPSHIAGQLHAGALLILAEQYKLLSPTAKPPK